MTPSDYRKEELKRFFEANMLDGDKVDDCGGAMLSASSVWEFLDEYFISEARAQALKEAEKAINKAWDDSPAPDGYAYGCGYDQANEDALASVQRLQQSEEGHEHRGTEYVIPSDGEMWCEICGKSFKPTKDQ